jgi:hypothetical protein
MNPLTEATELPRNAEAKRLDPECTNDPAATPK